MRFMVLSPETSLLEFPALAARTSLIVIVPSFRLMLGALGGKDVMGMLPVYEVLRLYSAGVQWTLVASGVAVVVVVCFVVWRWRATFVWT